MLGALTATPPMMASSAEAVRSGSTSERELQPAAAADTNTKAARAATHREEALGILGSFGVGTRDHDRGRPARADDGDEKGRGTRAHIVGVLECPRGGS